MPDVEKVLVTAGEDYFAGSLWSTETPAGAAFTSASANGLVRVVRVGGNRRYALDRPRVVLDCFKPTRPAAKQFALAVADWLFYVLPGTTVEAATVTKVIEVSGPSWAPWDNTDVRRFVATYQVFLKATA